jgi:predicted lysophospholipase L1 biosynthesis ABC-type transport system permease subunit
VAIARAFSNRPRILFADEPTGNLDASTGARIVELIEELNRESSTSVVLVTHDLTLAARAGRMIRLADGIVVEDREAEREREPETAAVGELSARWASRGCSDSRFPIPDSRQRGRMSLTTPTAASFHDPDVPRRKSLKTLSRALLSLAWRESRTARRRLLLYMSSISLGVAALVAIDSFASNVTGSVREQSRALLGGDVALARVRGRSHRKPTRFWIRCVPAGFASRVRPRSHPWGWSSGSGGTRLVQVRAVTPEYPFYGVITTSPAGKWAQLQRGQNALVDQSLLISLDARIGDTLTLGYAKFAIIGALVSVPGDPGISATIGPRVFIPATYLESTKLLGFGSRADYDAFAKLPEGTDPATWLTPLRQRLERNRVRARTVVENEVNLTESIDQLSDFLGVVGLVALLLGGIGVASGVHAFVARKIDTVAMLRCLGATSRQVLIIYVLQAAVMGFVGAAVGAALGVAIQYALPLTVR